MASLPPPLTASKAKRLAKRPRPIVRGKPLAYPAGVQDRLEKQIRRRVRDLFADAMRAVRAESGAGAFAMDAAPKQASAAKRIMSALQASFDRLFGKAEEIAKPWARATEKASSTALHASLSELSGGLSLQTTMLTGAMKDTLETAALQNAALIRNIGQQAIDRISQTVYQSIATGNGLQDLIPTLQSQEDMSYRRARTIAYDQTRKAYSEMNRARLAKLGVKRFEWVHSGGGVHPRKEHAAADGKVYDLDNPPHIGDNGEAVLPGQAINCRCTMVPVIEFGDDDAA